MPSFPFLGSLFSSTPASNNMAYPDKRSDDEWQAVLNPGTYRYHINELCSELDAKDARRAIPDLEGKGYRATLYWQI